MRPSLRRGTIALLAVVIALALGGNGSATTRKATLSPGEGKTVGFCGGQQLGANFLDVWACGPRPGYSQPGWPGNDFEAAGQGFQCVELANRFLWAVYALRPIDDGNLNGGDLVGKNYAQTFSSARTNVKLIPNGTPNVPYLPGDVVSFSDGGLGHVAVVTGWSKDASGKVTVHFMEENLSKNGTDSAQMSGWTLGSLSNDSSLAPLNFIAPQHIVESGGASYLISNGNASKRKLLNGPTRACLNDGPDLGAVDSGALAAIPAGPSLACADINGDHVVDSSDLTLLLANYGTKYPAADLNGNGLVDLPDFSILLSLFGKPAY